jgi:hypothetical protein
VADRWAFVVAVEKPLHPEFGTAPYAEAGAKAIADALLTAGVPKANQAVLLGQYATKAAIDSRLRKLRKAIRKGGEVTAVVAGRVRAGAFVCWDTLADDLADTGLSLAELVAALEGSKAEQVVCLFDAGPDDGTDLDGLFVESAKAVGLAAADAGEESHAAANLKATVWAHLVADALTGRAPKAVGKDARITAASLQRHLKDELPRTLRKHFESGVEQTPRLLGDHNGGFVVADLSALLGGGEGGGLLDPARLRRVVFRSESTGRVKDLAGFRKTFNIPENAGSSNRKFIARIAAADLKADVDGVFDASREHLGYKRKDVEVGTDGDGFGFVRGPDFEYTVSASLDVADPSQVTWRREVGQFADPGFVRSAGFDAVFGKLFDQLVFEFAAPADVAALVDRLEDSPPKGVRVHVSSDGKECDVSLTGFAGRVTVGRSALTVRGRAGDSAGLLDQFLRFLRVVGPVGEVLALE